MPQDAFTIRIAAGELNSLLSGGRVNKITQPTADEVLLQVYSAGKSYGLVVSANAQSARISTTRQEKNNPQVAPAFCMLLRKHLSGATITAFEVLGYERICTVKFSAKNDFFETVEKALVCELMGKYSNLFLTENGKILGTLKPFSGDLGGQRILLTGMNYTLPPEQDKVEITDKTRVIGHLLNFEGDLSIGLSSLLKGISRQTAGAIATEFFGTAIPKDLNRRAEEFYSFLLEYLTYPKLKPNVCPKDNPTDFYATDYKNISGEKVFFTTLIEAEEYYFDRLESERGIRRRKKELADKIKAHEKKLNKKLQLLREKQMSAENGEIYRIKGDLITAFQYMIPVASSGVELDNFYDEQGGKLKVELDPDLSANRNAQNYYKKYAKLKKTLAAVLPQIEEAEKELDYLSDLSSLLDRCVTQKDFDFAAEEFKAAGLLRDNSKPQKKKKEAPSMPKTFEKGGFLIRAGRNNLQNDRLTFSANRDDMWLHTKDFHSSHVIIECSGRELPDEVLLFAAEICAYYSSAREGVKVPVDYCRKRFVKKPPKSKPGGVIYTDFKTILVTPNAHTEAEKTK